MLREAQKGASWCEWKGAADYYDLVVGDEVLGSVAWAYPTPSPGFEALLDHVALYPGRVDRCTVDGERRRAAAGQLLRRLDHLARDGTVQGSAGHPGLVSRRGVSRRRASAAVG